MSYQHTHLHECAVLITNLSAHLISLHRRFIDWKRVRVVGGKGGDGCVSFIKYVREAHLVHTICARVCHQFNNFAEMFTAAHKLL